MDEKKRVSGLPIRFKGENAHEIPGTNKIRVVLPAVGKRDSETLFGVDENYVERDKLPASVEFDRKLIKQDKKNPAISYTYLDPNKEYTIKWYGQGWETPAPINVSAQVLQQAFGMGKSRTREQMKALASRNVSRNQRGDMKYESNTALNQKNETIAKSKEEKIQENVDRHIPIIFTEKQIVNRSEYSHKKTKEELARLEAKPEEKRTQYEIGRIQELKRILEQPKLMMYKIILPDAAHRKDLQFDDDRFGIARNERIAYIELPKNICHYDKIQQLQNESLQKELDRLEQVPEEKRLSSQRNRVAEIKKELGKPMKMYIYVPETLKKGIKIHFEGEKTGVVDKETGKPVYDNPEDLVITNAHVLRTAFGMGHYYSKEERAKMAPAKEQKTQSKGFIGRIADKLAHKNRNDKQER